jgi:glucose-6-phosphate 1-epimerase
MSTQFWQKRSDIPGRVTFSEGNGNLPRLEITTPFSSGELYLNGATVTHFQLKDQPPLLFLSQFSRWANGQAIRGGIPVIFPWFGPREGSPQHGFARNTPWELKEITPQPDGSLSLHLSLPEIPDASLYPPFKADYLVTFGKTLTLELLVKNLSPDHVFEFENCLHTYFHVGHIDHVSVAGLKGAHFLDKADSYSRKTETEDELRITRETDRAYLGTTAPVQILDPDLRRRILVEKEGSASTVVWNPWTTKSQQMPDFGNDEHLTMLCVESGNVADDKILLAPGKSSLLKVSVSSQPL